MHKIKRAVFLVFLALMLFGCSEDIDLDNPEVSHKDPSLSVGGTPDVVYHRE